MQRHTELQRAVATLVVALVLLLLTGAYALVTYYPGLTPTASQPALSSVTAKSAAAPADPMALQGKALFANNCASCHAISQEVVVGPGLQGINRRRDQAWLVSWIRNSAQVVKSGDPYAAELYKKFNGVVMPKFNFSDEEMKALLHYLKVAGS